jgi:hypothetical protein
MRFQVFQDRKMQDDCTKHYPKKVVGDVEACKFPGESVTVSSICAEPTFLLNGVRYRVYMATAYAVSIQSLIKASLRTSSQSFLFPSSPKLTTTSISS